MTRSLPISIFFFREQKGEGQKWGVEVCSC